MTYLLFAISFLGSVVVTILLRRRDRRSIQPAAVRRVNEVQSEHIKRVAAESIQQIKDASLEFELLVRRSRQSQTELTNELGIVQEKLDTLKADRELIETISSELSDIAGSAAGVSTQVERLDDGLARLGFARRELDEMTQQVKNLRTEMTQRGRDAESELQAAIERLVLETEERTGSLIRETEEAFAGLREEARRSREQGLEQLERTREMAVRIDELGDRVEERVRAEADRYADRFAAQERSFQERFGGLEAGLTAIRATAIEAVQRDTQRIRTELDNFNLEAMSRRDEILNETRRMAEGIGDQISLFQEKYLDAENRLKKQAGEHKQYIQAHREQFEQEWTELVERQSVLLEERISSLQEQLEQARSRRLESLETEAGRLVTLVEGRVREGEELIRRHTREEEQRLQTTREELGEFRDGMTLLGHELKASLRAEGEHGLALLRESRRSEEETIQRSRNDFEEVRRSVEEQLTEAEEAKRAFLARLEKDTQARRDEYGEHLRQVERLFEHSEERQRTAEENIAAELQRRAQTAQNEIQDRLRIWARTEEERHAAVQESQSQLIAEIERQSGRLSAEQNGLLDRLQKETENVREEIRRAEREALASLDRKVSSFGEEHDRTIEKLRRESDEARAALSEAQRSLSAELNAQSEALLAGHEDFKQELLSVQKDLDAELARARETSLDLLEKRAGRFLSEQDEKLGRLSETIDEKISRQILLLTDKGRLRLEDLEKRTAGVVGETVRRMEGELDQVRDHFRRIREEIADESEKADELRSTTLQAIDRERERLDAFGQELRKVERAEELIVKLDETLEVLADRLALAGEENRRMDDVVRNLESLRSSRKELESELRLLESQRGRLGEAEKHFEALESRLNGLQDRFLDLDRAQKEAVALEGKLRSLQESRESLDRFFSDLGERKKFLENAVRYIEGSRQQALKAGESAEKLLETVGRAEMRQEDVGKQLSELESRAASLSKLDREFQKVEARFEQMDGLFSDLDSKQKQVAAMVRRTEEMRTGADRLREDLESIVSEADEKMERMSAFFQVVDQFLEEHPMDFSGQAERPSDSTGLSDVKRNGILSLYLNHKWEPDLIAERMRLEPAVVRAVIASHK